MTNPVPDEECASGVLPKGTDFNLISDKALAKIVDSINHRPRKCLDYQTPHEVFERAKRVALGM
jgi:IS30 family transposase